MALDRRPARPTTRALRAAPGKSPTQRAPAQKPAGRTTRAKARPASGLRPSPSRTPLIVGGAVGGAILLIALIAVVAGKSSSRPPDRAPARKAPKPVDVSQLEREGMTKCEQGLALIQGAYNAGNKANLQKGVELIREGNSLLEEANRLSGHMYDTKKYNEALKMARNKILELK